MEWLIYLLGALIILCAGVMVGFVVRDKQLGKYDGVVLKYKALTPKSKSLVDGYIHSRGVNDERTTYRERK